MISHQHSDFQRGFHLQFSNGWLISVQIGAGNYHDARNKVTPDKPYIDSPNAEVAVWHRESPMVRWADGDTIQGWVDPDRIARIIHYISNLPDDPRAWSMGPTAQWLSINGKKESQP